MTKYKKYYVGEKHYQWEVEVKVIIDQKHNLYKFVLDNDEDPIYITSSYVTSTVAAALERIIEEIMHDHESAYESLTDIYFRLKDTSYGQIFLFPIGKGKKSHRPALMRQVKKILTRIGGEK